MLQGFKRKIQPKSSSTPYPYNEYEPPIHEQISGLGVTKSLMSPGVAMALSDAQNKEAQSDSMYYTREFYERGDLYDIYNEMRNVPYKEQGWYMNLLKERGWDEYAKKNLFIIDSDLYGNRRRGVAFKKEHLNELMDYADKHGIDRWLPLAIITRENDGRWTGKDKFDVNSAFHNWEASNRNEDINVTGLDSVMTTIKNFAQSPIGINRWNPGQKSTTGKDYSTMLNEEMEILRTNPDLVKYIETYNGGYKPAIGSETWKFKKGGVVSKEKAGEILRDGTVHGHQLTEKQRRYFGWIRGGSKAQEGMVIGDPPYHYISKPISSNSTIIPESKESRLERILPQNKWPEANGQLPFHPASGAVDYVPIEMALLPGTPMIKGIGKVGNMVVDALNPIGGIKSLKSSFKNTTDGLMHLYNFPSYRLARQKVLAKQRGEEFLKKWFEHPYTNARSIYYTGNPISYYTIEKPSNIRLTRDKKILTAHGRYKEIPLGISYSSLNKAYVSARSMTPDLIESVTVHEGTHQKMLGVLPGAYDHVIGNYNNIKFSGKVGKRSATEYYTDPSEVHARIMELRNHYNIKPDQFVNDALINRIIMEKDNSPVSSKFYKLYSNEVLKELFNTLPIISGMSIMKPELYSNPKTFKMGGLVRSSKRIKGASHEQGGVDMNLNGVNVEAEGGETLLTLQDGSKVVLNKEQKQLYDKGISLEEIIKTMPKENIIAQDGTMVGLQAMPLILNQNLYNNWLKSRRRSYGGHPIGMSDTYPYPNTSPIIYSDYYRDEKNKKITRMKSLEPQVSDNADFSYKHPGSGLNGPLDTEPGNTESTYPKFLDDYMKNLRTSAMVAGIGLTGQAAGTLIDMAKNRKVEPPDRIDKVPVPSNIPFVPESPEVALRTTRRAFNTALGQSRSLNRPELGISLTGQVGETTNEILGNLGNRNMQSLATNIRANQEGVMAAERTNADIEARNIDNEEKFRAMQAAVYSQNMGNLNKTMLGLSNIPGQFAQNKMFVDMLKDIYPDLDEQQILQMLIQYTNSVKTPSYVFAGSE